MTQSIRAEIVPEMKLPASSASEDDFTFDVSGVYDGAAPAQYDGIEYPLSTNGHLYNKYTIIKQGMPMAVPVIAYIQQVAVDAACVCSIYDEASYVEHFTGRFHNIDSPSIIRFKNIYYVLEDETLIDLSSSTYWSYMNYRLYSNTESGDYTFGNYSFYKIGDEWSIDIPGEVSGKIITGLTFWMYINRSRLPIAQSLFKPVNSYVDFKFTGARSDMTEIDYGAWSNYVCYNNTLYDHPSSFPSGIFNHIRNTSDSNSSRIYPVESDMMQARDDFNTFTFCYNWPDGS